MLAGLDVEPARFWGEVLGAAHDPVEVAKPPIGPPRDPVVQRALARWYSPPSHSTQRLGAEDLDQLDALRDTDPRLGMRRVTMALACAEQDQIPRLLAIYGSVRRVQARLKKALEALHYALDLAERGDDRGLYADILQRLGVAYAFDGNAYLGLLLAQAAAQEYRLEGDVAGEGRSLVDQGTRYFHLGRLDKAVGAYRAALDHLPEDEVNHRFGASQGLATCRQRQGSLHEALRDLRSAEELAPEVGPRLHGALLSTKAEILTAQGDYAGAERCYTTQLEIYRSLSPIDAAYVAVELVRNQLGVGKVTAALASVKSMATFLEPLKDNEIVSRRIGQLVAMALSGEEITFEVLDRVAQAIEDSRARCGHRARG